MLRLPNLRMALKALWANRLRALLTILGIAVGVASVVTLIAYSAGVERELLSQFDQRGATQLTMSIAWWLDGVPQSERLDRSDARAVRDECWTIEDVALTAHTGSAAIKFGDREREDCDIIAAEASFFATRPTTFSAGRPFTEEEDAGLEMVCVIGGVVYRELFFQQPAIGETIIYSGRPLRVIGVLAEQGGHRWESTDSQIVLPFGTVEAYFSSSLNGGDLVMKVREFELMPYAETQVRELLLARHPRLALVEIDEDEQSGRRGRHFWGMDAPSVIWAWSAYERREQRRQVAQSLTRFLVVMGALALLIGCVGVMNIMLVTVEERTAEIGLRKALGASSMSVLSQFLAEATLICSVGGFAGSLVAWLVCRYLERLPEELSVPDPIFTSMALAVAVTVTVGSGLAAGMYPALNAASLDPIEALRHE